MIQRCGDLNLPAEPVGPEQRSQLGEEDLDRYLAVVLEVVAEIDRGHSAPAQLPLDGVAARERGAESFHLIGRCGRLRRHLV